ncbi:MAG: protein kinase [Pirellulaceae bacterium]|nr:MAG: protein kinase [Pirellulaceae bacterium]
MPAKSVFRESVVLSGLLARDDLERIEHELRQKVGADFTDQMLAEELVRRGVVTQYQAMQLQAGRTKLNLGPYLVTDYIDKGGMGQVYKAVHKVMGRVVAVKVLPLYKSTPEAIETFIREIRMQAQLDHPNLVRAFDAGQDGRVHYLVTEYVPGTDLRRLVRSQGPLSMRQAANIIVQAATGLAYAHSRGLIHRDIKPGNILVTPEGHVKLSDLGLAGFIHEAGEQPRGGRIVGTPDYVAPELIEDSTNIRPVNDIYSLGCTLYYAVTGKVPFPGGSTADKLRRHLSDTPWNPRRFNPDVTEEFVEIIADMMAKNPAERIQTADDVVARLEPWAGYQTIFPSSRLTASPWMPPPVPTGSEPDNQDTNLSTLDDEYDSRPESWPGSQVTDASSGHSQETRPQRSRPPYATPPIFLPDPSDAPRPLSTAVCVAVALAIAVPSSMLLGAAIMYWVLTLAR